MPDPAQLPLPFEEVSGQPAGREWPALGTSIRVWRRFRRHPFPGAPVHEVLQVHTGVLRAIIPAGADPKVLRRHDPVIDRNFGLGARPSKYDRLILRRFKFGSSKLQDFVVTFNAKESTWMTMQEAEGGGYTDKIWPKRDRR